MQHSYAPAPAHRFLTLAAALALAMLCAAGAARAQVWTETGDAGPLVSSAQTPLGTGPLTQINGNLATPDDVDLYCIKIPTPPPPGAPLIMLNCVVIQGPNVWLFDPAGNGVLSGGTCSAGEKTIYVPTTGLAPGTYYVGVSYYGYDPQSAGGAIWAPGPPFERQPDGPGAAGVLTGWSGVVTVSPLNPYTINLNYINYCDSATPAASPTWGTLKVHYR